MTDPPPPPDAGGEALLGVVLGGEVHGVGPAAHLELRAAEHGTVRYSTVQYSTAQYSTVQTCAPRNTVSTCHSSSHAQARLGSCTVSLSRATVPVTSENLQDRGHGLYSGGVRSLIEVSMNLEKFHLRAFSLLKPPISCESMSNWDTCPQRYTLTGAFFFRQTAFSEYCQNLSQFQ